MRNRKIETNVSGRKIAIFLPDTYHEARAYSVVYIHSDKKNRNFLTSQFYFSSFDFITVIIETENRLSDYTPWESPALDSRFEAFGGQADSYLNWILSDLKPYINQNFSTHHDSRHTGLVGYSLGGLFNLYTLCQTTDFDFVGAISPSVWYVGFTEYFSTHLINETININITGGEDEGKNKKMPIKDSKQKIIEIQKIIQQMPAIHLQFALDQYGHHQNLERRYHIIFTWLNKELS